MNVKILMNTMKYDQFSWETIGNFKMITFLMGLQGGFVKFLCHHLWTVKIWNFTTRVTGPSEPAM